MSVRQIVILRVSQPASRLVSYFVSSSVSSVVRHSRQLVILRVIQFFFISSSVSLLVRGRNVRNNTRIIGRSTRTRPHRPKREATSDATALCVTSGAPPNNKHQTVMKQIAYQRLNSRSSFCQSLLVFFKPSTSHVWTMETRLPYATRVTS